MFTSWGETEENMHVSVALLLSAFIFEKQLHLGAAFIDDITPLKTSIQEIQQHIKPQENKTGVEGGEIPICSKKFVPSLFFKVEHNKANWFQAYQYCRFHGMHLISIESEEDEKKIMDAIEKTGASEGYFPIWRSGTDLPLEGSFVWMTSGKIMTYKHWRTNEPNGGAHENCVSLNKEAQVLEWNDVDCFAKLHFACEYFESKFDCRERERATYV